VLRWFCWMWLVSVVGRCGVGCEHCEGYWVEQLLSRTVTFTVLAPHNAAPHNRYQPHPAEPAQHTTCSNTRLVLQKMDIMMSETCWESVDNKHLTVASCWFSLLLHNLLTMHGDRNLRLERNTCLCCGHQKRLVGLLVAGRTAGDTLHWV